MPAAGLSVSIGPPDATTFCRWLSPRDAHNRCVLDLHRLLGAAQPAAALPARLDAIEGLARWVIAGPRPPLVDTEPVGAPAPIVRLGVLGRALERVPEWRAALAELLGAVMAETSALRLFADVGLPNDRGFLGEASDRLSRRLLPAPPNPLDLADLLARCFRGAKEAGWLDALDPDATSAFAALLGDPFEPLRAHAADAVTLLATRVASLGLSEDVRTRGTEGPVRDSPFFRLPLADPAALPERIAECHRFCAAVHDNLERSGVSVDVVYRLDVIARCLDRIEALLPMLRPPAEAAERARAGTSLLAGLAIARARDRSFRELVRSNLRLLARKIIERAGQTGEHYITTTRREYWAMLASAGGGGVLTAGTCVLKFLTKWGHYPLFVDGMLSATNYALSFIVMQLFGFTLATKQPSMTAAALAGTLRETRDRRHELDALVTLIARICRSQLAAAVGNILLVIPAAIAFHLLYRAATGADFLDDPTAARTVASLHPTGSGTIFYAALTGVLLWLSSLGAGWLENWATYRRLPEAIAEHRARRLVGARATAWTARFFTRHVAGFGGNLTLGFLLGMTPVMGTFFGLPLDVRHVTLSTGSLALAACAEGTPVLATPAFLWAAAGIAVIGLLNFGVSFVLALAIALRARGVDRHERFLLLAAVLRRFVRAPREFLLPPRGGEV